MLKKRVFAVMALSAALAACGGSKDDKLSRESGVALWVNNSTKIVNQSITKLNLTVDNAGSSFEKCTETRTNSDNYSLEVDLYDNKASLDAQYCDQERESVATYIKFQSRFVNNTLEEMPITFKGVGVEIRIYDNGGDEVWNSIISQDVANQADDLDAFDPFASYSVTLKAGETFPNQNFFPTTYYFIGDRNYQDYDSDPGTYDLDYDYYDIERDLNPGLDVTQRKCAIAKLEDGETVFDPVNFPGETIRYKRPLCQTVPLPVGTYHVVVEYSFTPAQPSVEFDITINPAS